MVVKKGGSATTITEQPNGLLTAQELAESGPPEAVRLPLELVDPSPSNPRRSLPEVDALAQNIVRFGLMQPIFVRRQGDRYEVLAGHRRRAAFLALREQEPFEDRWRAIPAVVVSADDETAGYMLISAQAHIVNWKPREQAMALERLALAGMTLREIGERLNRSTAWASKRLRVYADSVLSGFVQSGQLSAAIAEELLPVQDLDTKRDLAERAAAEHWSQDQIQRAVRTLRLDKELTQIGRRTQELLDILEHVQPEQIPLDVTRNLWTLYGRIEMLSGRAPKFPTIEAAQKAAGIREIRSRAQRTSAKRKAGYKPRA